MISGKITHFGRYVFQDVHMKKAQRFLLETDWQSIERKTHIIQGDDIYMMYHEGVPTPLEEGIFEVHERYVDIHITVLGMNFIRSTEGINLENITAYDAEKDLQLGTYHGPAYTDSYLGEGFFGLYAPGEAHLVNTTPRDGQKVGRFILKVKVE